MRERYDLNEMLKEIKSESDVDLAPKKNEKVTQTDISKLFGKNKLKEIKLGKSQDQSGEPSEK